MRAEPNPSVGEHDPRESVSLSDRSGNIMTDCCASLLDTEWPNILGERCFTPSDEEVLSSATREQRIEGGIEAPSFESLLQEIMKCYRAFCNCSGTVHFKHLEFERFLRRCLFAAHETNGLSVSSPLEGTTCKPFWLHYPPSYFLMAHDVVQSVECGTPHSSSDDSKTSSATTATLHRTPSEDLSFTGDSENEAKRREHLRQLYILSVQPVVPRTIRKQLAQCAKRESAASPGALAEAVRYMLDVYFFFIRMQFLPPFNRPTGSMYSTCVQFMTRVRGRLLTPEVAVRFTEVALVLILLSVKHQSAARCALDETTDSAVSSRLELQFLFSTYFPALVVAFLSASPLQSMEELRHSLTRTDLAECLPALQTCRKGAELVRELFDFSQGAAPLWSVTLSEVVAFATQHLQQKDKGNEDGNSHACITSVLGVPSSVDDCLFVCDDTTLDCLLRSAPKSVQKTEEAGHERLRKEINQTFHRNQTGMSPESDEFHRKAMRVTSSSPSGPYNTLYFSLHTLANMESLSPTALSLLLTAIEKCLGPKGDLQPLCTFASSEVCTSLPVIAAELLRVVVSVLEAERSMKFMEVINEVRDLVYRGRESL